MKTPCTQDNYIFVPSTFSVLYCDLLNSADRDLEVGVYYLNIGQTIFLKQIRDILREYSCGFFFEQQMVCCPYGEVTEEPSCDPDVDLKPDEPDNSKAIFYESLHGRTKEECGKRTLKENRIRIAEGKEAAPSFECRGTRISLKTVLTSAHCLDKRFS